MTQSLAGSEGGDQAPAWLVRPCCSPDVGDSVRLCGGLPPTPPTTTKWLPIALHLTLMLRWAAPAARCGSMYAKVHVALVVRSATGSSYGAHCGSAGDKSDSGWIRLNPDEF